MAAKFLGQFLLERGTLTPAQLLAALDAQRASNPLLGELAIHRPTHLSNILAGGVDALMPPIDGLPEHLMSDEFARRFGTVGSPAYQGVVAEIERRIAALALFQSP
jgi:hypothetical protein